MNVSQFFDEIDKRSLLVVTVILSTLATLAVNESFAETVEYNKDVNELIKDGLNECSDLFDKPNCLTVMSVLDDLCKVDYYPNCFGDQWVYYFDYSRILALNNHTSNYNDEYLNQNNEHFGNSSINGNSD